MNNFKFFSYAIAHYKIGDVIADVYFAPAVLEAFYSKEELFCLSKDIKKHCDTFDSIFAVIKNQVQKYNTYEMWYDIIEYNDIKLVWKSRFNKEKQSMFVEVLYSRDNHPEEVTMH